MEDRVKDKIRHLKLEIDAIKYTNNMNNLELTNYDVQRMLILKSKIQVLNEILIVN